MYRFLAAAALLASTASPCLACSYNQTSSVVTPSTTVAAQPAAPGYCPNCVTPQNGPSGPQSIPGPQKPS